MKFVLVLVAALALLSCVSAHVTITPNQIPSVGSTVINLQLSHSCNVNTSTTKVVVMFPRNITSIKPVDKVGWRLNRSVEQLGRVNGVDQFYYNFTWEIDPTIYQGLPDWAFDILQIRVSMTAGMVPNGSKFVVPVWQYCTQGLVYAWISGTSSGHEATFTDGVAISTAPTFSVIDPNDIQFIPSQANVKSLSDQITNITAAVTAFQSRIVTSRHQGEDHGEAVTVNTNMNGSTNSNNTAAGVIINHYHMDDTASSADQRADALSIIAIVAACISTTLMLVLGYKYHLVTSTNDKLLAAAGTTTAPATYTKDVELQSQAQAKAEPVSSAPALAVASAPALAPAPETEERRNTSTPSTQHEGEAAPGDEIHQVTFHA